MQKNTHFSGEEPGYKASIVAYIVHYAYLYSRKSLPPNNDIHRHFAVH